MNENLNVVFAEEDTLFRLMEVALLRRETPAGERTLTYFFGPEHAAATDVLTSMADRLGLPDGITTTVCADDDALELALPDAGVLIFESREITAAHLRRCAPRVKLIQKFGRDLSNLDRDAARELGLTVANLNRFSSQSSADHITALIFALARRLIFAHEHVRAQRDPAAAAVFATDPPRNTFNWARVRDIRVLGECTIGFVGFGENSGFVAKRFRDMGVRVLYFKRTPLSAGEERALGGVTYAPLDALLAQSDFVSLHLPYNAQTERFADRAFLAAMKPGAYLINTARGGVLDEAALYDALANGHLAGAALDVYRYEPVPPNSPLLALDNVLWTPHISGGQPEFMLREAEDVLTNIASALAGRPIVGAGEGASA
jgi:phosphoglycerate dehydrogenase-like enzyme